MSESVWKFSNPKPVSLSGRGLFSFAEQFHLDLPEGIYGITGQNGTSDGADSNMAGKSSFLRLFWWVLRGELPPALSTLSQIVNRGSDEGVGCLVFEDEGRRLEIERTVHRTKGQKLSVRLDGVAAPEHRKNDMQALIDKELLRIPIGVESRTIFFHTGEPEDEAFVSNSTGQSERYRIFAKYLGLEIYNQCSDTATKRLNKVKVSLDSHRSHLARVAAKIEEITPRGGELDTKLSKAEALVAETEARHSALGTEVGALRDKADCVADYLLADSLLESAQASAEQARRGVVAAKARRDEILGAHPSIDVIQSKISELKQQVSDLRTDGKTRAEAVLAGKIPIESERRGWSAQLTVLTTEHKDLTSQLSKALTCPHCSTDLMLQGVPPTLHRYDMAVVSAAIETRRSEMDRLDSVIAECDMRLAVLEETANVITATTTDQTEALLARVIDLTGVVTSYTNAEKGVQDALREAEIQDSALVNLTEGVDASDAKHLPPGVSKEEVNEAYLTRLRDDASRIDREISKLSIDLRTYRDEVGGLKEKKNSFDAYESERLVAEAAIQALTVEVGHYEYWRTTFKQIRDSLVERMIPSFESETNLCLQKLGVAQRVRFSLTVETASGDTKNCFQILVWDGKDWYPCEECSRGEWGRVSTSIGFAFRRILSYRSSGAFPALFLCDEVADSLDVTGMGYFFRLLREQGGLSLIVSHRPVEEVGGYIDRIISIVKTETGSTVQVL